MKKRILLFAVTLFAISFTSCSNDSDQTENNQNNQMVMKSDWPKVKEGGVKTVWTIGRKSRNCDGIGICRHEKTSGYIKFEQGTLNFTITKSSADRDVLAYVSPAPNSNGFSLLIDDAGMEKVKKYFGTEALVLEEDYQFTLQDYDSDVEVNIDYLIKAGTYNFSYDSTYGCYEIVFND